MKKIKESIDNPLLSFRISTEMYERLTSVSEMYGVSRNEVARIAIGQYVGQVTGALNKISEGFEKSMPDMEKMANLIFPMMVEASKKGELG